MPMCPDSHFSVRLDFCDVCGRRMEPQPVPPPVTPVHPAELAGGAAAGRTVPVEAGLARGDLGRGPAEAYPPDPSGGALWLASATADRAYHDRVIAAGTADAGVIQFPGRCPERRFRLQGREMRIGRRASRGIEPEIDLTGPPTDPGISHLHAVLLAEPGGGWAVLDPGSANGTLINGRELAAGQRVTLRGGDRINLGAWTALTVHAL
jgi:hypothetical protein